MEKPRELSAEEKNKLAEDSVVLSDFKRNKLELDAKRNWDLFYKRNTTNFFKDRHWTSAEFKKMFPEVDFEGGTSVFEAGCGVGNFILPFIENFPSTSAYACDFSPRAVQMLKESDLYLKATSSCIAFVADITEEDCPALHETIPSDFIDIATLIFVLSAVSPSKMDHAVRNLHKVLKRGGSVVIRDYGLYDHAMFRFQKGKKIEENFYVRQDGTRAYYFSLEKLEELFCDGWESVCLEYIHKETTNKKEGLCVPRIFVQARFRKL